jgi:hypothetical protein
MDAVRKLSGNAARAARLSFHTILTDHISTSGAITNAASLSLVSTACTLSMPRFSPGTNTCHLRPSSSADTSPSANRSTSMCHIRVVINPIRTVSALRALEVWIHINGKFFRTIFSISWSTIHPSSLYIVLTVSLLGILKSGTMMAWTAWITIFPLLYSSPMGSLSAPPVFPSVRHANVSFFRLSASEIDCIIPYTDPV